MTDPLYHTGDQHAEALLSPLARELGTLATRASHYTTRLRMSDHDRTLIETAQRILEDARNDLDNLISGERDGSGGARG